MWSRSVSGTLRGAEDSRIFRWSGYMREGPKFTNKPGFLPFRKAFVYFPCKNKTFHDFHLARIEIRICICFAPRIRYRIEIKAGSRSALKPMRGSTTLVLCSLARMKVILFLFPLLLALVLLDCIWNEDTGAEDNRIFRWMCEGGQHLLEDEGCAGGPSGPVQEQRRRGLQVKHVLGIWIRWNQSSGSATFWYGSGPVLIS